jgi:hypothetical protein
MKRLQLTDEEVRHIEQRRLMENRTNLGYNEALTHMVSHIEGIPASESWGQAKQHLLTWADEARRTIKP